MTAEHSANDQRTCIYVARIPMRWRDMDINRHVNNTVYFRYFEQARIEWCDRVRAEHGQSGGLSFVIAAAHCHYLKPLVPPGTIEVIVYAGTVGRSSFTLHYDIYMEGDRSLKYAEGYTRQVWIERAGGRSAPLPDFMRVVLA